MVDYVVEMIVRKRPRDNGSLDSSVGNALYVSESLTRRNRGRGKVPLGRQDRLVR